MEHWRETREILLLRLEFGVEDVIWNDFEKRAVFGEYCSVVKESIDEISKLTVNKVLDQRQKEELDQSIDDMFSFFVDVITPLAYVDRDFAYDLLRYTLVRMHYVGLNSHWDEKVLKFSFTNRSERDLIESRGFTIGINGFDSKVLETQSLCFGVEFEGLPLAEYFLGVLSCESRGGEEPCTYGMSPIWLDDNLKKESYLARGFHTLYIQKFLFPAAQSCFEVSEDNNNFHLLQRIKLEQQDFNFNLSPIFFSMSVFGDFIPQGVEGHRFVVEVDELVGEMVS